jgi:hypothetical protein
MITDLLSPDQESEITGIRDQIAKQAEQLYTLGERALTNGYPDLERAYYRLAEHLTFAQMRIEHALVLATTNKEEKKK